MPAAEDDDRLRTIKERIFLRLTEAERRIFLMWVEKGSYAAVARLFKSSPPTVRKRIAEIMEKLKK